MNSCGFEKQAREPLSEWRPYNLGEQPFGLRERLCSHRGEQYVEIGQERFRAWSEGAYEWIVDVTLDGQYFRTLRYSISESLLIGKSIEQIHQHMRSTFAGHLQIDLRQCVDSVQLVRG